MRSQRGSSQTQRGPAPRERQLASMAQDLLQDGLVVGERLGADAQRVRIQARDAIAQAAGGGGN